MAVYQGRLNLVKFLISRGANVNQLTRDKSPIIFLAIKGAKDHGNYKVYEDITIYLINKSSKIHGFHQNISLLLYAVDNKNLGIAKVLLNHGAEVNPLHKAQNPVIRGLLWKDYGMIKLLLSKDPRTNFSTPEGVTPLHIASYYNEYTIAKLLIDKGAIVDSRDVHDITPLFIAIQNGCIDIINLLIEAGASKTILPYTELVSRSNINLADR